MLLKIGDEKLPAYIGVFLNKPWNKDPYEPTSLSGDEKLPSSIVFFA